MKKKTAVADIHFLCKFSSIKCFYIALKLSTKHGKPFDI